MTTERQSNSWHKAYARWYDHDRAGHRVRAFLWGVVTDIRARTKTL